MKRIIACLERGDAMLTREERKAKSERRRARLQARAEGRPLTGELALRHDDRDHRQPGADAFGETERGHRARERWARRYDALDGAPEGEWDR